MPEVKDIIYYVIYGTGIITTGILSFMIWRATKQSIDISKLAVEAARQSAEATKAAAVATKRANEITETINKEAIRAKRIKEQREIVKLR